MTAAQLKRQRDRQAQLILSNLNNLNFNQFNLSPQALRALQNFLVAQNRFNFGQSNQVSNQRPLTQDEIIRQFQNQANNSFSIEARRRAEARRISEFQRLIDNQNRFGVSLGNQNQISEAQSLQRFQEEAQRQRRVEAERLTQLRQLFQRPEFANLLNQSSIQTNQPQQQTQGLLSQQDALAAFRVQAQQARIQEQTRVQELRTQLRDFAANQGRIGNNNITTLTGGLSQADITRNFQSQFNTIRADQERRALQIQQQINQLNQNRLTNLSRGNSLSQAQIDQNAALQNFQRELFQIRTNQNLIRQQALEARNQQIEAQRLANLAAQQANDPVFQNQLRAQAEAARQQALQQQLNILNTLDQNNDNFDDFFDNNDTNTTFGDSSLAETAEATSGTVEISAPLHCTDFDPLPQSNLGTRTAIADNANIVGVNVRKMLFYFVIFRNIFSTIIPRYGNLSDPHII